MASRGLGTLTLDLILKMGGFEQGMNKAARLTDERMKKIEARAKAAGVAIGAGLVAAATGAAAMTKRAIDAADEMSKLAQKVGISTEQISRLAYAGDLADVSLADLQTSIGRLIKSMGDAQSETSTQARIFKALGIEV